MQKARGEDSLTPAYPWRVLSRSVGRQQEPGWVLGRPVQTHLEMQVRPGRPSGRADRSDLLTTDDEVALLDEELRSMRVTRDQPVAVVDLNHLTILGMHVREDDLAAGRGDDRRPGLRREIQPLVKTLLSAERIDPPTEARRQPTAVHRRQARQKFLVGGGAHDQCL